MNNENSMAFSSRLPALRAQVLQDRFSAGLFLALLVGLVLRFPNLNESLWFDELWSTHIRLKNLKHLAVTALNDVHPPFYNVFMFVWTNLFGDSELSVRAPALLFGILSIPLAYALTSILTESKTALLTALLLSLSPVHIWYSQEARPYAALLFFLLLSIYSYIKLRDYQAKSIWLLTYFVALFSCVMTHFYLSVHAVLFSMMCLVERHKNRRRILGANFLILFCLAAWMALKIAYAGLDTEGGYLRPFTFNELWNLFFNWFLFGNTWNAALYFWALLLTKTFFLVLFIRGAFLIYKESEERERSADVLMYLFILPLLLFLFAVIGLKNYIERSMFVALPFFYIIIARGVMGFETRMIRRACVGIVLMVNVITLAAYYSRDNEWTVYKPNPDWRSAARYFDSEANSSSDRLNIFTFSPSTELLYYDQRFKESVVKAIQEGHTESNPRDFAVYKGAGNISDILEITSNNRAQTFYLIHNRYWSGGFNDVYERIIKDDRVRYQAKQSFKGLEIYKFNMARAESSDIAASMPPPMKNGK